MFYLLNIFKDSDFPHTEPLLRQECAYHRKTGGRGKLRPLIGRLAILFVILLLAQIDKSLRDLRPIWWEPSKLSIHVSFG